MEQKSRDRRALAAAFVWVLVAVLVVATGAWGTLAITLTGRDGDPVRGGIAAAFALAALFALIAMARQRWRWRAMVAYAVIFIALLAWYGGLQPSNDRDWQTDVAVLPYADRDPQGKERGLLRIEGVLPPVRANLRGGR
jgi:apolipoprotein N-acyltransferase